MKSIFYYLWYFYMYLWFKIKQFFKKPEIKINLKKSLEEYSDRIRKNLYLTFENETINNNINGNIDDIFYNKEEFNKLIRDKNEYEEKWKRNILFRTTPREDGNKINIFMYYDVYKSGFAYYCDENSVSYNVLNNLAIQYVLTFHCRDFFIDESFFLEKDYELSPFIEKDKVKKLEKNKNIMKNINANKVSKECIYCKNKFIYLGKIRNFELLRKNKKTQVNITYDKCFNNINYKDFKKQNN